MHAAALRYFMAVAEAGSIRRAAERVDVSASAVNRQILKFEEYWGPPLFERHIDGLRLTDNLKGRGFVAERYTKWDRRDGPAPYPPFPSRGTWSSMPEAGLNSVSILEKRKNASAAALVISRTLMNSRRSSGGSHSR